MSVLSLPALPAHCFPSIPQRAVRRPSTIPAAPRRVLSELLLDGQRDLVIQHQGSEYHLRLTRNDRLILTK